MKKLGLSEEINSLSIYQTYLIFTDRSCQVLIILPKPGKAFHLALKFSFGITILPCYNSAHRTTISLCQDLALVPPSCRSLRFTMKNIFSLTFYHELLFPPWGPHHPFPVPSWVSLPPFALLPHRHRRMHRSRKSDCVTSRLDSDSYRIKCKLLSMPTILARPSQFPLVF